jgi:hypothetical protein
VTAGPEETARQDDPVESGSLEPEPEGGLEERPAPQQDRAESGDLEGAPRGDPTP